MLYVALAAVAALATVSVAFAGVIRSMSRAHARREDLLVNQLCSLAGKPWQPAPANDRSFRQADLVASVPELIANPEQWPDE